MHEMSWLDRLLGRLPATRESGDEHEQLEHERHKETMRELRRMKRKADENAELLEGYKAEVDAIVDAMEKRT
jgi:hypothetical protein